MKMTRKESGTTTKDKIINAMSDLMEYQGYAGTGLSDIVAKSQAPKGSIYHFFPGGKEEIAVAAIYQTAKNLTQRIKQGIDPHLEPAEAVVKFITSLAGFLQDSGYTSGGPLLTVASETSASEGALHEACNYAYQLLIESFFDYLVSKKISNQSARALALTIMAAIEGGIVLARTTRSIEVLQELAKNMGQLVYIYSKEKSE